MRTVEGRCAGGAPRSRRRARDANDLLSSDDTERFALTGDGGNRCSICVRTPEGVTAWERPLDIRMEDLSRQYSEARRTVERARNSAARARSRRGTCWPLRIWLVALALVWLVATRFSRPIVKLTEALKSLAGGDFRIRVPNERTDEIGLATEAFNRTAAQLEQSRDRLVNLTQLASWQVLARKTAHEVKNSLTPIRLTVEEMVARGAQIPTALSSSRPPALWWMRSSRWSGASGRSPSSHPNRRFAPSNWIVHAIVEERIAFLKSAHPEVRYAVEAAANTPSALADQDLVKGILVNLLENAAEAPGEGGQILARVCPIEDRIAIEVHDSGPGLSELARKSLFQPTISFKKRGMGLGLSIARKSALLSGGDILLIAGELGGAGFRVLLPAGSDTSTEPRHGIPAHSGR